jgi:hypothetical protein
MNRLPSTVYNTDQSGLHLEMIGGRTLEWRGAKHVFGRVQRMAPTTRLHTVDAPESCQAAGSHSLAILCTHLQGLHSLLVVQVGLRRQPSPTIQNPAPVLLERFRRGNEMLATRLRRNMHDPMRILPELRVP